MTKLYAMFTSVMFALVAVSQAQTQPAPAPAPVAEPAPHQQRYDPKTGARILPPLLYQNETPEDRAKRLGTAEDPGPDPDPKTKWVRFGKTYTIQKFSKQFAVYDQRYGFVRPDFRVNYAAEVYQENDEYVWVWLPDITTAQVLENIQRKQEERAAQQQTSGVSPGRVKYEGEGLHFILQARNEFEIVEPDRADTTIRFRESSQGLPQNGSWRNALDVADMNGDGKLDLVVPPPRGMTGLPVPHIFLGDGAGNWKLWESAKWPAGFDYGTAAVGDLNRDGKQDVVFGVHLMGVLAFLGDGKGNFVESSEGLPRDFPTRRVELSDLDSDGDLDIVAISEGAVMARNPASRPFLRAYLNGDRAKSWKYVEILDDYRRDIAGDWLTIADFNGDKRPDVAGASVIFNGTDLIYLSEGKMKWKPFGRGWLPFYSYYGALAAGKLTSKNRDDLVMTYTRFWPGNADPEQVPPPPFNNVVGIDHISFTGKEPRRTAIRRWEGQKPVWGLALADFNRDRAQDIIYWDSTKRAIEILLGDGAGKFRRASVDGLSIPENILYDIKVADVNADKTPDVILMFEQDNARTGAIRVWLGERSGPVRASAASVAKQ